MRVNWFSPLPGARTDIAHYTGRILPALAELADVTLWTDQEHWDPALERYARVEHFHPDRMPWERLNCADATFYNIGNNCEFHADIWAVSRRHPGIAILHDVRLQEMFAYWYRWMYGDREGYTRVMEEAYGAQGRIDASRFWEDDVSMPYLVERYPLTHLGAENARGVVVHTADALETARAEWRGPVACVPLPYPANPSGSAVHRPSNPPYRLIVFGYIHSNRRLDSVLQALSELSTAERAQFRLDIYGQLWDPELVRQRIWSLAIEDIVQVHGFVPEEELTAALDRAHLAINLRYPSMGEASGSQLRIWDRALPSLVTPVGMYAHLPDEAVDFVRYEHEVEDLHRHLRTLTADPEGKAKKGRAGRRVLETLHTPEIYVRTILDFARTVRERVPNRAMQWVGERAAAELRPWMPSQYDSLSQRVATEILAMADPQPPAARTGELVFAGEHASDHTGRNT